MARRKQPAIPDPLLDQLLAGADAKTPAARTASAVQRNRGRSFIFKGPIVTPTRPI